MCNSTFELGNTGKYAMIHLPHYVASCMLHTGKKREEKLHQGGLNSEPPNQLELAVNASILDKTLGTVVQYSYFSVISRFSLKTVHPYFHCFRLGQPTIWLLGLEQLLQCLSPRNEEKQYGRQIHPPLLTDVEQTLNIYFAKQTVKLKKDFQEQVSFSILRYLQYRCIYSTFKPQGTTFVWFYFVNGIIITQKQYNVKNC